MTDATVDQSAIDCGQGIITGYLPCKPFGRYPLEATSLVAPIRHRTRNNGLPALVQIRYLNPINERMLIRIRSHRYHLLSGTAALLRRPQLTSAGYEVERSPSLENPLILANCLAPNMFTSPPIVPGAYDVFFRECTIRHLPSAQTGLFCNVLPLLLLVTEEHIHTESVDLDIVGKSLLRITLFRNGVPVPHAAVTLAGEMVTLNTHTDDRGSLVLIEDPRDILALDFDRTLVSEILLYDEDRTDTLSLLGR